MSHYYMPHTAAGTKDEYDRSSIYLHRTRKSEDDHDILQNKRENNAM